MMNENKKKMMWDGMLITISTQNHKIKQLQAKNKELKKEIKGVIGRRQQDAFRFLKLLKGNNKQIKSLNEWIDAILIETETTDFAGAINIIRTLRGKR